MSSFVVVGTDTDAGKTTFSLLFLAAFSDLWSYWKPLETGDSDSQKVATTLPQVLVHARVAHFAEAVAPALAARRTGRAIPSADELALQKPVSNRPLLIETFGSPASPLNDQELQSAFLKRLKLPLLLVASSTVGAVGRVLQSLAYLRSEGLEPEVVVLMGPRDTYAESELIPRAPRLFSLAAPKVWDRDGIEQATQTQLETLQEIQAHLQRPRTTPAIESLDSTFVWHPYEPLRGRGASPIVVGAEGEWLELANGGRLIDAFSSWWTILHGHRHPPLVAALQSALGRLDHLPFAGFTHPDAVLLAEKLIASTPWKSGRVFYSDNGSTAVEVALKSAYQYWCHRGDTQRTLFIGFEDGYHGDTFGAMAVGRDPLFFGRFEPFLFRAARIPVDPNRLEELLKHHAHETAAVILEPRVQGAGGMKMHTPETLRELFEVAKHFEIPVIADEVMTGNRTGKRWAFSHAGVEPDWICAAKTLTGGMMPLAATLVSPRIVEQFENSDRTKTFFHGHSFTAHPLACAVALANETIVEQPDFHLRALEIESFFRARLEKLRDHPAVADVRVSGGIAAVELHSGEGYLAEVGSRVKAMSLARGVVLRPLGNVIYAMPPFCSRPESLERIAEVMIAGVENR